MNHLSEAQLSNIIRDAVAAALQVVTETAPLPELLTIHQLCGIFNKDTRAVKKLGIPRVVLGPSEYRYDRIAVEAFIEERTEGKPTKEKRR